MSTLEEKQTQVRVSRLALLGLNLISLSDLIVSPLLISIICCVVFFSRTLLYCVIIIPYLLSTCILSFYRSVVLPRHCYTQLQATVDGLGTGKFELGEATVAVSSIIAAPNNYVLLDSRTEEEMAVGIIPGAITKAAFEADPTKYADKEVVCYCTVGYISGACTYELRKKGHTNVKNMGDGALLGYTLAQTAAGVSKPLVKADGTATNEVHCFMPPLAALAGEGMVGKSFADPPAMLEAANASIKERTGL